jgi:hypothetical protein
MGKTYRRSSDYESTSSPRIARGDLYRAAQETAHHIILLELPPAHEAHPADQTVPPEIDEFLYDQNLDLLQRIGEEVLRQVN